MGVKNVTICPRGAMERSVRPYSNGFKARMVQRMAGPTAVSAGALSREVGVPQPTLSAWLREARTLPDMGKDANESADAGARRPAKDWTAEEKLKLVIEAARVPEAELGALLRQRGLHAAQLEEWRRLVTGALQGSRKPAGSRPDPKAQKQIKALERELQRKDKALAEVTALLALKKKLEMLWGDEADDTPTRSGT